MVCSRCGLQNPDNAAFCCRCGTDLTFALRIAAAMNPRTPPAQMEWLAGDHNDLVRYRLAENPVTPLNILARLARDNDPFVVRSALAAMELRVRNGDHAVLTARSKLIETDPRTRAVWDEGFETPINLDYSPSPTLERMGGFLVVGLLLLGVVFLVAHC